MLRLDGETHGLILVHPVLGPEGLEDVPPEITPQRLLDDLARAFFLPGSPHPHPGVDLRPA